MTNASILDYQRNDPPFDLRKSQRIALRASGKRIAAQVREIWRLSHSTGRLEAKEYYDYQLYDDSRFTFAEKLQFLGEAANILIGLRCTDPRYWGLATDKIVFDAFMHAYGFPVPRIMATYHPFRRARAAGALHTKADVKGFLSTSVEYPFFGKPAVNTAYSLGTLRVDALDPASGALTSHAREPFSVDEFVEALDPYVPYGYLFQEVKHPHERIREICGDRLATVRMMVMSGKAGPEIYRTVWKIPAGPHVSDNYWRGNLLAAVEVDTGCVTRVVTGGGHQLRELERHPDTGMPIKGVEIPEWAQAKELCLSAASALSGLWLQAWDIAICPEGPVLIEVGHAGDFRLPQIATGVGMLDERFREYLARACSVQIVRSAGRRRSVEANRCVVRRPPRHKTGTTR
jgi:hypothetical protein